MRVVETICRLVHTTTSLMRTSQLLIPTLRHPPGEADIISHRLMTQAGMIRKVAAGIYTYLPLGLRVLKKIECIIRQEMNRAGAQELLMPILAPADLWRETGRWDFYGKELLRCQDRHTRDFCFGPTHEEVITDLFRREIRSYRQLPLNCYQIQTKFRDEIRPRFGLMRGREFVMKDAYSFDADEAGARLSYQKMYTAYERIFTRCGLTFRAVEADNGLIGGSMSHEFMVLSETGEETIVYDERGSYAANVEQAAVPLPSDEDHAEPLPLETVHTPGAHTVQEVCTSLQVAPDRLVKTLLYQTPAQEIIAVLIRGDHEANTIKLNRFCGTEGITLARKEAVSKLLSAPIGFLGPIGLTGIRIIADHAVKAMRNFVVGGNKIDTHLIHANWGRDFTVEAFLDLRQARAGDPSPQGDGRLQEAKGIEVGHVFLLGTKYSEAMQAKFLDASGHERAAVMGCYGIGVSRTAAAAVEQNHDDKGMIWPVPIAPFHIHLLPVTASENVLTTAGMLYDALTGAGLEVLWDDRDERAGVKFNDADLIGAPFHLPVGDRGLAQGIVELKRRDTGDVVKLPPNEVLPHVQSLLAAYDLPNV